MAKIEQSLKQLNLPISEVLNPEPNDWEELITLKVLLGAYLANLERLFRGVFGQELELEGTKEQYALFKKVFPIIGEAMDKSFRIEGFPSFCKKLSAIRNSCLHGFSMVFKEVETIEPKFMFALPNWAYPFVQYITSQNRLTLGGLLAILLCMGNKEMISHLMESGLKPLIEKIGLWYNYQHVNWKNYGQMVETVLGNDFEQEIRTSLGKDVLSAIWGEYSFRLSKNGTGFSYRSKKDDPSPEFHVNGSLTKKGNSLFLAIWRGSFYQTYFPDDYVLEIADEEYFIECANQVPPFLFVVYLYQKGVSFFDRQALTEFDQKVFPKLNKAKFHVDKSIHIILLDESVSDQRLVHQYIVPRALYAILHLEWNIRIAHKKEIQLPYYSTIKESLEVAKIEKGLTEAAIFLRNFFAHGYILGSYVGRTDSSYRKFELLDCLDVFQKLVLALEEKEAQTAADLKRDIGGILPAELADSKYKILCVAWYNALKGKPIDWFAYKRTEAWVSHSYIIPEVEEKLGWFRGDGATPYFRVVEVDIKGEAWLLRSQQKIPEGVLTVVLANVEIPLNDLIGKETASQYRIVSKRTNAFASYVKYQR